MATGLVVSVLLTVLPGCTARHLPHWSRVQAVSPQTKIDVRLYTNQKFQGRFHSAADDSLTLTLRDGQTRTLEKQSVQEVLARRPLSRRLPGWTALVIAAGLQEFFMAIDQPPTGLERATGHTMITLPISALFFYGSRMGGIYEVPPKYRTPPPAKQPAAGKKALPKPKDSSR